MSAGLAAIQKSQASASHSSLVIISYCYNSFSATSFQPNYQVSMVSVWESETPPWEAFVCRKDYWVNNMVKKKSI